MDKEVVFNGRWEVGLNAGGVQKGDFKNYAKNPQCFIELRSPNPEVSCDWWRHDHVAAMLTSDWSRTRSGCVAP